MANLIYRYEAFPTVENATKLREYNRKHPFASMILTDREFSILADALSKSA